MASTIEEEAEMTKQLPVFHFPYHAEMKYVDKLRDLHGLTAVFSVSGRAYDLSRGADFFPTVAGKKVMMRFDYDGGFGEKVVGNVLTNPTWLDVWKAADQAVRLSGDLHHIYFECVYFRRMVGDIMVFELGFGS